MMFNPRLSQILTILLSEQDGVLPMHLAEQCKSSTRTIYRELEHVDRVLKKYGLTLNSRGKKGIVLEGCEQGKQGLLEELEGKELFNPRDRERRQRKLIMELFRQDEPQKIFYFSELLKVSETTIGNDLDALESWFGKNKIQLVRKSGVGVFLEYEEMDYRKALYHFVMEQLQMSRVHHLVEEEWAEVSGLLDREIFAGVLAVIEDLPVGDEIGLLTEGSLMGLVCYITIAVKRILTRKSLFIPYEQAQHTQTEVGYGFVERLMKEIEGAFLCSVSRDEVVSIYQHYRGSKRQTIDGVLEGMTYGQELEELKAVAYEMCDVFDPKIASQLKEDEGLIHGLAAHLQPTFNRLEHDFVISNPLLADIKEIYPDIFEKSVNAAGILERKYGYRIPEDEVGFLALHFGGAMVRLSHKKRSFRRISVGVICESGIGISSLLSSKLKQLYGDRVQIKIYSKRELDRTGAGGMDMLVTTFDLVQMEIPVVKVHPILTEENIRQLSQMLEQVDSDPLQEVADAWEEDFDETVMIVNEMNHIIHHFQVGIIKDNLNFDQVLRHASEVLSGDGDAQEIYRVLWERERLSSQVIPEYEIALLHGKTDVVEYSKLIVLLPEGGHFVDASMENVRAVLGILIPKNDKRQVLAVSAISSAIFEEEGFLELIKSGNQEKCLSSIKRILNSFFEDYMHRRSY